MRGFVREVLSLVTWISAFFIASHYYSYLAIHLINFHGKITRNSIAVVLLFLVTLIFGTIINNLISSLIERSSLSGTDRILGLCFGALRGILVISAVLFFLKTFTDYPKGQNWKQSQLIPYFNSATECFFHYMNMHPFSYLESYYLDDNKK